ncbi:MAG TPA: radical SAM protein [Candidatus Edwardsbacteria bacterium]|nr:radical SAM protein [Candidatus Edwardsbacteria bacterium]
MPTPLYADPSGRIFDLPGHRALGLSGGDFVPVPEQDLVPLPAGSEIFVIGKGIIVSERDGASVYLEKLDGRRIFPVAAFMPAGYTRTLLPGYVEKTAQPLLPLWSYTALAWHKGKICGAARLVAKNPKADPELHSVEQDRRLVKLVRERLKQEAGNRLLRQLARCALEYHCFAGKNTFYRRWELPLPTSPSCNARCLGCLSWQPQESAEGCCASQQRLDFVPAPREIADLAVPHLQHADAAIASFGQGCEGEPLLQAATIEKAIRLIRAQTGRGTINLNTNGYDPARIRQLARAGLDSVRISLNSSLKKQYDAYYRPVNYAFADVKRSIRTAKAEGLFVSVNLLVFPGYTDREQEVEGLLELLRQGNVDMVQMRNLSIDPWWYIRTIPRPKGEAIGIARLIDVFKKEVPSVRIDYFNIPVR